MGVSPGRCAVTTWLSGCLVEATCSREDWVFFGVAHIAVGGRARLALGPDLAFSEGEDAGRDAHHGTRLDGQAVGVVGEQERGSGGGEREVAVDRVLTPIQAPLAVDGAERGSREERRAPSPERVEACPCIWMDPTRGRLGGLEPVDEVP